MKTPSYYAISEHYENCLQKHGATHKGVDWPNQADLETRFKVMLGLIEHENSSLLDLGCGYGAIVPYLPKNIHYSGIDISHKMIETAKKTFPNNHFISQDILTNPLPEENVDYVIMNGLLTEKRNLPWHEMCNFAQAMILAAFKACKRGIAFNVMNYHVAWSYPELFYWSFDELTAFLYQNCSRHVIFRADYGLYEFTAYVYKHPKC